MNALDMLQRDHRKVKSIIYSLNATLRNDTHSRRTLILQLIEELKLHEQLEEKILYPALKQYKETRALAQHSYDEHREINNLLKELAMLDSHQDEWKTKLAEFQAHLDHHIDEEERELFPKALKVLGEDELDNIGMEIAALKDLLTV